MTGTETARELRPLGDFIGVEDHALAEHICSFATRIAAATCAFLLAVAEYDRRQAWAAWECRSMTDWLSWRCGVARVTAAHYCRTAAALAHLPLVRERFEAGELSYSQVRAIAKVANSANEAILVDLARSMTANQLERVTATYQRTRAVAEQTSRERDRRRTFSWGHDDDGSVTGVFRLAPEEAAVLIKAVAERLVAVDPTDPSTVEHALDPVGARRADALVELAAADLERGAAAGTGDPGDRYLVTVVVEADVLEPEADVIEADGDGVGVQAVEVDGAGTDVAEPEYADGLGLCQLAGGPGLAPSTIRRLLCDQPSLTITRDGEGNVLDVGRRTRRLNRALRRALAQRDDGCRFPGCSATRVDAHHIVHWVDGGHTRLDNLISLCKRHHHRHHDGGFTIEVGDDGTNVFVLANGLRLSDAPTSVAADAAGGNLEAPDWAGACTPDWDGTRLSRRVMMDIIDALLSADGLLFPPQHESPAAAAGQEGDGEVDQDEDDERDDRRLEGVGGRAA